MFNIDFSQLPDSDKKLSSAEVGNLNSLFQDAEIQKALQKIEEYRKIRQKWKVVIYSFCTIVAIGSSYYLGTGENIFSQLISGFFYTIGTGDDSAQPVIYGTFILYSSGIGFLYKKFQNQIEIPLKKEVLSRMCPLLYSKLEYSHDEKFSFNELGKLNSKGLISSYDQVDNVEDSIQFTIEQDGKMLAVNGFEIKTSEMRRSGKRRRRVITNHCYLLKAVFPNARIPLKDDILILPDILDGGIFKSKWDLLYVGFAFLLIFAAISGFSSGDYFGSIACLFWVFFMIGLAIFKRFERSSERVKLENIAFEKLFDVQCHDQITSRMIITPAFMDRIVSFVERTGNQYAFLFEGNTMYIKRFISGKYLEAGTEKNMTKNVEGLVQFYTDMKEIVLFIHDMNIMYLSKTDVSRSIENERIATSVNPIAFSQTSSTSGFGSFFSKLKLSR